MNDGESAEVVPHCFVRTSCCKRKGTNETTCRCSPSLAGYALDPSQSLDVAMAQLYVGRSAIAFEMQKRTNAGHRSFSGCRAAYVIDRLRLLSSEWSEPFQTLHSSFDSRNLRVLVEYVLPSEYIITSSILPPHDVFSGGDLDSTGMRKLRTACRGLRVHVKEAVNYQVPTTTTHWLLN